MPAAIGVVGPRRCLHSSACMRSLCAKANAKTRAVAAWMKHADKPKRNIDKDRRELLSRARAEHVQRPVTWLLSHLVTVVGHVFGLVGPARVPVVTARVVVGVGGAIVVCRGRVGRPRRRRAGLERLWPRRHAAGRARRIDGRRSQRARALAMSLHTPGSQCGRERSSR